MTRPRHPDKDIEAAVAYAESHADLPLMKIGAESKPINDALESTMSRPNDEREDEKETLLERSFHVSTLSIIERLVEALRTIGANQETVVRTATVFAVSLLSKERSWGNIHIEDDEWDEEAIRDDVVRAIGEMTPKG